MTAVTRLGVSPRLSVWARVRSALPRALMAFGVTLGFGIITGGLAGAVTQDPFLGVTAAMTLVGLSGLASLLLLGLDVAGMNPSTDRVAAEEEAQRVTHAAHGDLAGGLDVSAPDEGGALSVRAESGALGAAGASAEGEVVFAFEDEAAEDSFSVSAHHDRKGR